MTQQSPNLSLPLLQPSQAQKHVTHNEALVLLDHMVQLSLEALDAAAPPAEPAAGSIFGIGAGAGGEWAGRNGQLAAFINGGWVFLQPREGWRAFDRQGGRLVVRTGNVWTPPVTAIGTDDLPGIGIGTQHDSVNRFAVRAPATLLSHEGSDHRLKINKAGVVDTASLLFQSGFSGRAEIGLAGEDALSLKVSADGAAWTTALRIAAQDGRLTAGTLEAEQFSGNGVQSGPQDTGTGRVMRADYGYCPGNLLGPVALANGEVQGAVIERGSSAAGDYVRFADGTLICHADAAIDTSSDIVQSFGFPAAFATDPAVSVSHLTAAPHTAIELPNIRIVTGSAASQAWSLRLGTPGTPVDPAGPGETLRLTAIGRWA